METQEKVVGEGFKRLQLHPFACKLQPVAYRGNPAPNATRRLMQLARRAEPSCRGSVLPEPARRGSGSTRRPQRALRERMGALSGA